MADSQTPRPKRANNLQAASVVDVVAGVLANVAVDL
jgi:hypothetical protein